MNLSTSSPELFYSLIEATCFATKAIIDHFVKNGVLIKRIIAIGGVAANSPYVMQLMSDTIGMDINVSDCKQAGALGSVIHAATIAEIYPTVEAGQMSMCKKVVKVYKPRKEKKEFLMKRYEMYKEMEAFSEKNFK